MHGYEALADALVQEGMDTIFSVISEDFSLFMYDLTKNRGVRLISCRNERGAAAMAEGYARTTGKVGVVTVTAGSGLTNATTSLLHANRIRSSVLCITTTSDPTGERDDSKRSDQRLITEGVEGKYIRVRHQQTLAEDIQLAFRYVRSGLGSAVLSLPRDVMSGELDLVWEYSPSSARMPGSFVVYPDPDLVNMAVDMLVEAKKPVILMGQGAVESQAEAEIRTLSERTGALLATTHKAKSYLSDHPYHVGVSGVFGEELTRDLLRDSDCVVAVGASLNSLTTARGFMFPDAKIIHIDKDAGRIGEFTPVDLGIVGDVRATLAAINACLESRKVAGKQGFWTEEVRRRIDESRVKGEPDYVTTPDTIDPRQLVAEMDRLLPKNRLVVTDGGHGSFFVKTGLPDTELSTLDTAGLGLGLHQAIGAAVGRPDRHVVLFVGDGALMMSLEELDTAARYRLPMTIVVMNDNAYGAEVLLLKDHGLPGDMAFFAPLEFEAVARSLGVPVCCTVRNANDLRAVSALIGKGDGPVLIDVKTNLNVVHHTWQRKVLVPPQRK